MENNVNLYYVNNNKDIERFWKKRNEYMLKDIIPHCDLGDELTSEDVEWFFSKEYKDHIMKLYKRNKDPLYIVFIKKDKVSIGFITYIIYNREDGKCFVLDYCIYQQYRNSGIGKIAFNLLEKDFITKGATYIHLNVSNINNERFWVSNGFAKTNIMDEQNNYIYRKDLMNTSELQKTLEEKSEIREILRQFQRGYTERDLEIVDAFVEDLFTDDICVLGTGTGELFLGHEQVKTLIKDDWKYWGDVKIDSEYLYINSENTVAWFATTGNVKYTFENTQENYDSYLNFIKNKTEDSEITPKQKITFINWVLALAYHQRLEKKREYLWPLRLSGVLIKDKGKWKFANIHFSIPVANFPDERFENSKEYIESYNNQNVIVEKYKNNQIATELKTLLKSFESDIVCQENISIELFNKYFAMDSNPYIIGTENQWCIGAEQIREFFAEYNGYTLSLDLEHAIASKHKNVIWVTAWGKLKQTLTEEDLYEKVLGELENLFQTSATSEEKLFAIHRSIAYGLKESAAGADFTYPIRLTAVILEQMGKQYFQHIHFSFPFQWILEGKIDRECR